MKSLRLRALLLAFLVTVIWSFSWVLIKIGLHDELPPLTFAALRYTIAFVCLLPFLWRSPAERNALRRLTKQDVVRLLLLGLLFYTATQGLSFVALKYLPAATYSLLLNFTAIGVMLGGIVLLREIPTPLQYAGVGLFIFGLLLYFYPAQPLHAVGLAVGLLSMVTNAASSLLGRAINRSSTISPLLVTGVSMGTGSLALLVAALLVEGWTAPGLQSWAIIVWLAVIHTAFAFTLWNRTLRVLSATESSIINNTMLIQTALLAWLFLGESLSGRDVMGLIVAALGILIVQIREQKVLINLWKRRGSVEPVSK
ncbi:MAG: DMT family transporter [Caldilineaceae bacterium]|nr:DMT family transporter [Caldilineaceae bacterium]